MEVLRTAILDWVWRKKGKSFSPLQVIQQMYPQSWEYFEPDILNEMMAMFQEGLIQVSIEGQIVDLNHKPTGKEMIQALPKTSTLKKG